MRCTQRFEWNDYRLTVNSGGCYADLASACGQPGAVECSNLAANASRACCPQDTTCADNYNASEGWVRCNIERTNLQRLAASTSSMIGLATASSIASEAVSSASTSSTSSRSSPTSASTSASAVGPSNASSSSALATSPSQTSSPNPSQSSTLSGGVIAGIVIGSVLAMLLAVVCWFLWKRQKAARSNTTNTPYPPPSSTQFSDYYSPTIEPFEQAEKRGPSELTGGRDAQEVDGSAIQPVHGARSWMSKRSDQRIELE